MKNILIIIIALVVSTSTFSQAPMKFNYQAVARDIDNNPYQNTNLGIRVSLIRGGSSGVVVYSERHLITTSDLGVFSIQIGTGTVLEGDLTVVDWGIDSYYIKVDMDPNGGTDYINMGVNQLLSVPYALYAQKSGNGGGADADADPTNEIQVLSLNGTQISLSNGGGTINLPTGTTDTDDQTLSLNGTILSIDDGNSVDLASLPDAVNDADADPNNEIQTITLNGTQISLSNGGGTISLPTGTTDTDDQTLSLNGTTLSIDDGNSVDLASLQDGVDDADADPNNEIQTITLNGTQISLSNGGGTINLPTGTTDTDDQTLSLNGTTLSIDDGNSVDLASLPDAVNDADADPNNEIQTITLNGTQISLSNGGGTINLPENTPDTDDQTLTLSGTTLSIDNGNSVDLASLPDAVNDADADPTNEIQLLSKAGSTVSLSNGGGSFVDEVNDADNDPNNEIQTIAINGNEITLSNGGGNINLPPPTIDTDDQTLSLNGTTLSIESGNTVNLSSLQDGVTDADADPSNELQALSLTNNELSISGGNAVDLTSIASPWIPTGDGISYVTGITNTGLIQATEVKSVGLDKFSSFNSDRITVKNTFANVTSTLESHQLEFLTGLNSTYLQAASLSMSGAENSVLTDHDLNFINTSGNSSTLNAMGIAGEDLINDAGFSLDATSGLNLHGYGMTMEWGYYGMAYVDDWNNSRTYLYPGQISFGDPFLGDLHTATMTNSHLTFWGTDVHCNLNENQLYFYGPSSQFRLKLESTDRGEIHLYNPNVKETAILSSDEDANTGYLKLKSDNGNTTISLSHLDNYAANGYIAAKSGGLEKAVLYAGSTGTGRLRLRGTNSTTNVLLTAPSYNSNNGYMAVYDWQDNLQAGIYVNSSGDGVIFGDIKNFRMDHPRKPGKEIWYASLEGPEAGAYERGTATLENGELFVKFSEHFGLVGNYETMTVSLTPLSADTYGLAVVEKTATGFKVKELAGGTGNFSFDWEVKCVRKGYEHYKVIRDKGEEDPVSEDKKQ